MNLQSLWYAHSKICWLLWPVSLLYRAVSGVRRAAYRTGLLARYRAPVPVVIVGNISVGGTGKTPLTISLVSLLQRLGWSPAVVSRGYGGELLSEPQIVGAETPPSIVGDEPVLIATQTGVPVCVFPRRQAAIEQLLNLTNVNIIICDDGLQHYALQRDVEIAVIDQQRGHGNGMCLPAGPLREPVSRLSGVDFVVYNSETGDDFHYTSECKFFVSLDDQQHQPVTHFAGLSCHAVAGIGNPARFFNWLSDSGITAVQHPFPDHHRFVADDIDFHDDLPVLMTEKDAVKCRQLPVNLGKYWMSLQSVTLSPTFESAFIRRMKNFPTAPPHDTQSGTEGIAP